MTRPIIYHIPVCPFSQRIEILLRLKGLEDAVEFRVVDITVPRPAFLLELTGGTTALPVMDLGGGRVLKESMVILRYVEEAFAAAPVARSDPYERGIERLMMTREGPFTVAGYVYVMNRDRARALRLARRVPAPAQPRGHLPVRRFRTGRSRLYPDVHAVLVP